MKAFCYGQGLDTIRSHSLYQIVKALGGNGQLEAHAKLLDLYYISARYPDAFPAGAPFELLTPEQAQQALQAAREFYEIIAARMPKVG